MIWGLFKKVVIADGCGVYVDDIFLHSVEATAPVLILGSILFAFQIYCDFSGYSDIAIGTARLLGFNLMRNFAYPYFSRDIAEFWRRWHISLSTWFRDYVYIPMGGSRAGRFVVIRNVFIIFIVSGFWHGANWTFIFWGLLNALYFLPLLLRKTNRVFLNVVAEGKIFPSAWESVQILYTFSITCLAWIFFRAENMTHAWQYLRSIFIWNNWNLNLSQIAELSYFPGVMLWVYVIFLIGLEWLNRNFEHGMKRLPSSLFIRWSFYILLVFVILQYFGSSNSFIYFAF